MLVLHITLLTGRYDAASSADPHRVEWPPHPARAFCGLVASAKSDEEWSALRWLERQGAPEVWASGAHTRVRRSGFVVTNKTEREPKSLFHPGRSNLASGRTSAQPGSDEIDFVWRVDAPAEVAAALTGLALRLPYLGRSTSTVIADVFDRFEPSAGQVAFLPGPLTRDNGLRVPYDGYLDMLREQHEFARPAWEAAREVGYIRADQGEPAAEVPPVQSPFAEMVVFPFAGIRPLGALCALFTGAFRKAVLAAVPDPLPAILHGHEADNTTHAAFLALPNIVGGRASGDLLGLALALPPLAASERARILRPLVQAAQKAQLSLSVTGLGRVALSHGSGPRTANGLAPQWWTRPSRVWTTATPMFFDHHPKQSRGDDAGEFVADSCMRAGLPEPIDVMVTTSPLRPGTATPSQRDLPDWLQGRLMRHVRLEFATEVRGPVLVGRGRYLGLGLFAPDRLPQEPSGQSEPAEEIGEVSE